MSKSTSGKVGGLLKFLFVLVIVVVAIGLWRDWFAFSIESSQPQDNASEEKQSQSKTKLTMTIDRVKVRGDAEAVATATRKGIKELKRKVGGATKDTETTQDAKTADSQENSETDAASEKALPSVEGVISQIDVAQSTVTVQPTSGQPVTGIVASDSRMKVSGESSERPLALEDLRPNARVRMVYRSGANGAEKDPQENVVKLLVIHPEPESTPPDSPSSNNDGAI